MRQRRLIGGLRAINRKSISSTPAVIVCSTTTPSASKSLILIDAPSALAETSSER